MCNAHEIIYQLQIKNGTRISIHSIEMATISIPIEISLVYKFYSCGQIKYNKIRFLLDYFAQFVLHSNQHQLTKQ